MTDQGPDLVGYLNRIVSTYGLEPEAFLDLFASQDHRCAICRKGLVLFAEDQATTPVVDHNHGTGAVRGILCRGCNTAVGYVEKDYHRTRRVFGYLRKNAKAPDVSWSEHREAGRGGWAATERKHANASAALDALDTEQPAD